jgi:hypothetical protein
MVSEATRWSVLLSARDSGTESGVIAMTEVVVPEGSIPGHPKWIAATIKLARHHATYIEYDARPLAELLPELRAVRAWETWLPNPPETPSSGPRRPQKARETLRPG